MRATITWISRGRKNCTGQVLILREQNNTILRNTCDSCSLNWTVLVAVTR